MKTKQFILASVLAASSALQAASAERKLPAPMPEFKTSEQLAKWREEKAKANATTESKAKATNASGFYTGKTYLEETGTYSFLFRSFDPELNRWTTTDPSGFPDGANSNIYSNSPTFCYDPSGLAVLSANGNWSFAIQFSARRDRQGNETYNLGSKSGVTGRIKYNMTFDTGSGASSVSLSDFSYNVPAQVDFSLGTGFEAVAKFGVALTATGNISLSGIQNSVTPVSDSGSVIGADVVLTANYTQNVNAAIIGSAVVYDLDLVEWTLHTTSFRPATTTIKLRE